MNGTFTCARCGKTSEKGCSDEDAAAAARRVFSAAELEAVAVVCDDCWRELEPHLPRLRAELDQQAAAAGVSYDEFMRGEA